jgi:predicted NBD/HSP70 family sugar kinase
MGEDPRRKDFAVTPRPRSLVPETPTPQALATVTDRLFFEHLRREGPTSRAAIAAASGLSKPTVSEAATRLTEAGLIHATGQTAGPRGRSAAIYDIVPGYGHALAVSVATGSVRLRAADLRGNTLGDFEALSAAPQTPAELELALAGLFDEYHRDITTPCLAAGISQANPVRSATQKVVPLPNAPFAEGHLDVAERFLGHCRGPVRVDNDVNWAALAEHELGRMRGTDEFLMVYIGPAIGAAFVMSGEVHRGGHGLAGEIAYLRHNGRTVLERLLGLGVATANGRSLDVARWIRIFSEGGNPALAEEFIGLIGETIGNAAAMTDPGAIVLSGPMVASTPFVEGLRARLLPQLLDPSTPVETSELGSDAPLAGALLHARQVAADQIWANYRR